MKYLKSCLLTMVVFSLSLGLCFANDTTKFQIGASKELVDVTKLYVEEGKGDYAHCKALKGYPGEDKFQVYFQGDTYAKYITYEDLRGIDVNEIIEWELDGKKVRHFRKDIYRLFSDSIRLYSNRPDYKGQFSQDWHRKTFGHVYEEWIDGMSFSQDAQTLLKRYFEYKFPSPPSNRYDLRDMEIISN